MTEEVSVFSAPSTGFVSGEDASCTVKSKVFLAAHGVDLAFDFCVPKLVSPKTKETRILFSKVLTIFIAYSGITKCAYCHKDMLDPRKNEFGIPVQTTNIHPTKKSTKIICVLSCGSEDCNSFAWMARLHLVTEVFPSLRVICLGCDKKHAEVQCDHCRAMMYCSEKCKTFEIAHKQFCKKKSKPSLFKKLVSQFHIPLNLWSISEFDPGFMCILN